MKGGSSGRRTKQSAVSPEDRALFLAAIGGATPLDGAARDRVPVPPPPPSPVRVAELPPEVKLAVDGDAARYAARAPGVSHAQVAELRGGKVHATATLDLHGETTADASAKLRQFLLVSVRAGHGCVRVIHGKGTRSEIGAPLREMVLAELLGALSGYVRALASDSGDGATLVALRGSK